MYKRSMSVFTEVVYFEPTGLMRNIFRVRRKAPFNALWCRLVLCRCFRQPNPSHGSSLVAFPRSSLDVVRQQFGPERVA